jgi:hypothetical protein
MDTKYWGPSAWKLLHMATFQYNPKTQKEDMLTFLQLLPFVLPCKFCRKSLTEYYDEDPPGASLQSADSLSRWLWRIHNKVNDKLRSQGLNSVDPNPSYKEVAQNYKAYLAQGCSETNFPGWEMLFCILDNHPLSREGKHTKPFEYDPDTVDLSNELEKNKFNLLTPTQRLNYIIHFFTVLPNILPYNEWRDSWNAVATDPVRGISSGRKGALAWLWKIRSTLEEQFALKNKDTFFGVCSTLAAHRSSCSKSRRARTCRKRRNN